ncbi:hypothetical protein O2W14_07715 [Modestobacter sp. VKM Ac-2986]|uniref:hypothetical protein n=1 Tax=Modestobacter sp. VKM Ac-2986 TaxID=3004140 RepID=UPI0022AAECA2|nr:hypothetical protein [Modestobacter sp. VKM Ac-2986]MCZ2828713.1 hypothetical protein [Modestobacter sp. VKM Ac-2986]
MAPISAGFPYQFSTADGVPVRLHDMQFIGLHRRVRPPTLTLRFRYDDPDWTPPEAVATPVAVFAFLGVQIWQWEDDHDLFEVPDDVRGQVGTFDWHAPTSTFSLETINTTLFFSADRLTVHLEPLPPAE